MEPGAVCSVAVWSLRPGDCLSSATWRTASAVDRFMDATAGDGGADGSYTHTGHDWLSSCHARDAQNRNLLHALTRGRADRFYFHGHSSPSPYSVGKLKHQKTGRMNRPLRLVGVDSSCPSPIDRPFVHRSIILSNALPARALRRFIGLKLITGSRLPW